VEHLGLAVGVQAFALVKSSSVMIMTDADGVKLSARNRLSGKVARLVPGAVNTDVVIDLGGGSSVAAVVTNESARLLALREGSTATAIFKASSVIVGTPA
jgi:molybdate transport system regulatory protein